MKKIVLGGLLPLLFAACSTNSTKQLSDWRDSLQSDELSTEVRYNIAVEHAFDRFLDLDSIAIPFLTENLLDEEVEESEGPILLCKAEDGRALLMTVKGGGTMDTGTSYLLYRKDNGKCTVKKVAYPQPDPEGGMDFPAQYRKIVPAKDGYLLIGVFAFDADAESLKDTLQVSREFLESSRFAK